jgi:PhzF family phenazine biosynthesis protein
MKQRQYSEVDVFTSQPYFGNPLAVVLDGAGLDDEAMQRFARWTNLSETTFLLPPTPQGAQEGADYRVRIFTPGGELPFAGHPTLGSCHAWLASGGTPRNAGTIVQECAKGLVRIRQESTQLAFAAPAMERAAIESGLLRAIAQALGTGTDHIQASQRLDNGPVWHCLLLDSVDTVIGLSPIHQVLADLGVKVGVIAVDSAQGATHLIAKTNRESRAFGERPCTVEVRAFAAAIGVPEDPVTGSLNASLAQWLMEEAVLPTRYTATQGTCLGRHGQVTLSRDAEGQVWVGGSVVPCITGTVTL